MKTLLLAITAVALVAGCSTQQRLSCDQQWESFGQKKATEGSSVRIIDQYRDHCANFDKVALDAFLDGYARGLVDFCSYANGYEMGANGQPMSTICPYEIRKLYARGFNDGQQNHEREMKELDQEIERQEREEIREVVEKSMGSSWEDN